jgi:hypothetical protein
MRVQFTTNLGSRDAATLDLDHKLCTIESKLDVSEELGAELVRRGVAEAVGGVKAKPAPEPPADKK